MIGHIINPLKETRKTYHNNKHALPGKKLVQEKEHEDYVYYYTVLHFHTHDKCFPSAILIPARILIYNVISTYWKEEMGHAVDPFNKFGPTCNITRLL